MSNRTMRFVILLGWLLGQWFAPSLISHAQSPIGSVSGRVVAEDGQPLPRAQVIVVAAGANLTKLMSSMRRQLADAEGRFQADGLDPAAYQIIAMAPGYVMAGVENPFALRPYRIGDAATILMRKGGVITGKVTDAAGAPLVGINVSALPLENASGANGLQLSSLSSIQNMQPRTTDDRGQYRLYGLPPGKYVVVANGAELMRMDDNPFGTQAPTYYPSATRDGATMVTVNSGVESTGIDIRFRGGTGYAVSGTIRGLAAGDGMFNNATTVQLKQPNTDDMLATAMVLPLGGNNGFAFYGIPNGEYEIFARQVTMKDQSQQGSVPQRITVKNADVTKLELTLSAMAGVSGKLVMVKPAAAQCRDARLSELDETTLTLQRAPLTAKNASLTAMLGEAAQAFPDEQGAFAFTGLAAGNFWLTPDLPSPHWYLKTIAATPPHVVLSNTGIALKASERLKGLTVTLATDGARLQGRVLAAEAIRKGAQVFIVPAEPEAQNNGYRYAETLAANDGSFAFTNLAPGNYWLLVRAPAKPGEPARQPLAWDPTERAKLHREAVAANQRIELKACQQLMKLEIKLP